MLSRSIVRIGIIFLAYLILLITLDIRSNDEYLQYRNSFCIENVFMCEHEIKYG